ncbi:MAG: AarF/ABC1/UbiB kinase family protein [Nocardioidaceae bacterium]|nr:AarF/ABC1/UbiB kinase family protein [Nocardioidaceae bacterium]
MTGLPKNAVTRTARLASLPLGYAGRATLGLGRRLGGAPAEAVALQVQQRTAEQLFKVLGELKGGAMKFGQAMSIFESALPESLVTPYRATLTRLQDAAPPMPASMVHQVLSREFGPGWRELLVEFDDDPAAAASIGQVHHGRWQDGREVAVKIQYPGAGEALMSDLKQIARAARLFAGLVPGIEVMPLVHELRARVSEELDYALEADAQSRFAEAFAGDPDIRVPAVVAHTDVVLVSEWLESNRSLARLIADGSQAERNRYGEVYVRFLFSGPARAGLLHADPHPGNFRLLGDGRLGVVDYGAVARLPGGGLPLHLGSMLRNAADDEYDAVLAGLRANGFIKESVSIDVDDLRDYLSPFAQPAAGETFRFSRSWMRGQFARINDPRQPGYTTMMKFNLPPEFLLIHRVWLGGLGVLSQLEAEAPFAQILAESLPGFAVTPDGA